MLTSTQPHANRVAEYLLYALLLVAAALPTSILGSAMVNAEPMPVYASR